MEKYNCKSYLFTLDYGNRLQEREFIKDILRNFNKDELVGVVCFVNNNPYNLEFYLYLNFEYNADNFEDWLSANYNNKKRKYNYFLDDFLYSSQFKGYNMVGLIDDETFIDSLLNEEVNPVFFYPDRRVMNEMWRGGLSMEKPTIFLSHSSKDKHIVDIIFNELQKSEKQVWYDKYEIEAGDSISDKINDGLSNSNLGILIISKNFFDNKSGWPKSEMNYFLQKRMRINKTNFICFNIDLEHDELPPLLQDYRYINYNSQNSINELIDTINKKLYNSNNK